MHFGPRQWHSAGGLSVRRRGLAGQCEAQLDPVARHLLLGRLRRLAFLRPKMHFGPRQWHSGTSCSAVSAVSPSFDRSSGPPSRTRGAMRGAARPYGPAPPARPSPPSRLPSTDHRVRRRGLAGQCEAQLDPMARHLLLGRLRRLAFLRPIIGRGRRLLTLLALVIGFFVLRRLGRRRRRGRHAREVERVVPGRQIARNGNVPIIGAVVSRPLFPEGRRRNDRAGHSAPRQPR